MRDYYDDGYRHGRDFAHERPDSSWEPPSSADENYDYRQGMDRGERARRWHIEWDEDDQ